jgi:putative ABC transport system substrate-binding protein
LTLLAPELSAKRLEVLKEIVPGASRIAPLWDPTAGTSQVTATEAAARSLKVKVQVLEIRGRDSIAPAFQAARKERAEAVLVLFSPLLASLSASIAGLAAEHRLPAMYQWREHVEGGGLASYGPSLTGMWRQSALIVGKVLKGAGAGNLPVEQPTTFDLVLNKKTAQTLGLAFSPSLLLRADKIVD